MDKSIPKYPRILAIAPSTQGFGYAVIKDLNMLADWGVKWVEGDKNKACLAKVNGLIVHYEPHVVVLEDMSAKGSRRPLRIRNLTRQIIAAVKRQNIPVAVFSRQQMKRSYLPDGKGTRYDLTKVIAERFLDELGDLLPPKRRTSMVEHPRMAMFDAVALALMVRSRGACHVKRGRTQPLLQVDLDLFVN
jgi:Holliday junction resolvasome RuvABC endonuclease subunit